MGAYEKKKKRGATCAGVLLAEAILQQKQNTWRSILLGEGILLSGVNRVTAKKRNVSLIRLHWHPSPKQAG